MAPGISQDDVNLIPGGDASRLYCPRTPGGMTRIFKFVGKIQEELDLMDLPGGFVLPVSPVL